MRSIHNLNKERILNIMTQIGIVLFLLWFFIKQCPLIVFDCDDWMYLWKWRMPIPIWKGWEPTRIMPEILLPITGWLAAHIIYPICGDYVYSVTIISAIIITVMITGMCIFLKKFLIMRCHLEIRSAIAYEIMFLIFNFLIFRNRGSSQCMFTAADLCCIYFYTMSGIINAIVVLIFLCHDNIMDVFLSWNYFQKILFVILLYFALFSNLFHSAMTAIFAGVYLLFNLYGYKSCLRQFIVKNGIYLLILITWGIVLIFEVNGGRAGKVGAEISLDFALAVRQLLAIVCALSKPFVFLLLLLVLVIVFHLLAGKLDRKSEIVQMFRIIICDEILLTIFLLLLNSKCGYMSRIDASWGMWFFLITIVIVAIVYVTKNVFPKMTKFMPIIIFLFLIAAVYPDGEFCMSTREHTDYETCVQLDQYVIDSIIDADEKGLSEIEIRIPDHSDDLRSLAYNEGLGTEVANCLYTHGIITRKIDVTTILDKKMNDALESVEKR